MKTEFWYAEVGSRAEGKSKSMGQSTRWWLPLPQVPSTGLSENERKKLLNHGRVVHQVFKAAKSINESILLEMPVPTVIREAVRAVSILYSLIQYQFFQLRTMHKFLSLYNFISYYRHFFRP